MPNKTNVSLSTLYKIRKKKTGTKADTKKLFCDNLKVLKVKTNLSTHIVCRMPHYCKDVTKENNLKTKALTFYIKYSKILLFLFLFSSQRPTQRSVNRVNVIVLAGQNK